MNVYNIKQENHERQICIYNVNSEVYTTDSFPLQITDLMLSTAIYLKHENASSN
jgi:hypothetical protein